MLTPRDEDDIAEAVADASGPLHVIGGGTRPVGKPVDGEAISTREISGITLYEPGALTIVAKAGTPISEIEDTLAAEGQMLAFEPMDHRALLGTEGEPTIGGVVAANVSGPRRVSAGACRDYLLGVRFVDGRGEIVKNGGRVMKNVTGYDLVKLMAGSRGTLGVLTEVSLKVLPRPEAEATLIVEGLAPERAVAAMSAVLQTPFEVSGAFYGPARWDMPGSLRVRVEGMEESVVYRAGKLREALAPFGDASIESDATASRAIWSDIRDMRMIADSPFVARTVLKPGDAFEFTRCIGQSLTGTDYYDWGGGLVWTAASDAQLRENAGQAGDTARNDPDEGGAVLLGAMQEYMKLTGGHTSLAKGTDALRRDVDCFQPEAAPLAKLAQGLRRQFDPRGILNPGLMG